ncbi:hypothetical protein AMK19_19430 [Kitasatospora sp. CB01950]|nr:hypothetical protein [Kitasatospora sp. CB01950]OKJ08369.1 hypothetical protein AMK19_19430 [Kitasatospora sp. CB01950]
MVTVCRGCCCGSAAKHPGVDHGEQVARLRAAVGDAGRVRVSECLDACGHSNVVVVNPSPRGRENGARPVWLGWVLGEDMVTEIAEWVRAGGPGVAEAPATLELQEFDLRKGARS